MVDPSLLVGAGLGFGSALLCGMIGAWLQHKLALREDAVKRERERREREEVELRRIEEERNRLMAILADLRTTEPMQFLASDIRRKVDRRDREFTAFSRNALGRFWYDDYHGNVGDTLRDLTLSELQLLYNTALNLLGLFAADTSAKTEHTARLDDIAHTLRRLEDRLAQSRNA